jgi:hypothetical protein
MKDNGSKLNLKPTKLKKYHNFDAKVIKENEEHVIHYTLKE